MKTLVIDRAQPLQEIIVHKVIILATLLGLAVGCTSEESGDPRQRCTDLRDHVVDLRLKDVVDPEVDLAAHRAAMQQALGDHFVDSCMKDLTEKQLNCVMSANGAQAVAACSDSN